MANVIHAMFNDDDALLKAARAAVDRGVRVKTVYSPCPVHGLDAIIGVKKTRLAICAFIYGFTGTFLAVVGMWYFMVYDWPMNIGGKPSFSLIENLPAFIPITFELTVFCAAHGMALTLLLRNWTLPGVKARNPHPGTTDDKFVMEIVLADNPNISSGDIAGVLKSNGAMQVDEK